MFCSKEKYVSFCCFISRIRGNSRGGSASFLKVVLALFPTLVLFFSPIGRRDPWVPGVRGNAPLVTTPSPVCGFYTDTLWSHTVGFYMKKRYKTSLIRIFDVRVLI